MLEQFSELDMAESIRAQAVTAPVNGTGVDLANFGAATIVLALGLFAGTTPNATIQVQDSPDNVTYTGVPVANLLGGAIPAVDPATDRRVLKRGYIGLQRFIRVAVTAVTGTGPSLPMSAVVTRGSPRRGPV